MKVIAVKIPEVMDEVILELVEDGVARSRSELVRRALAEFIARHYGSNRWLLDDG